MTHMEIRKLADKEGGERITMFDPTTGEKKLVNPKTPGTEHEPWPLLGVQFDGDAPKECTVPTGWVNRGKGEGWITIEDEAVIHASGGPGEEPWRVTHTFVEGSHLVIHTVDGAVRYKITHNPGKYNDATEDSGYRVDWFYVLKLVKEKKEAKK